MITKDQLHELFDYQDGNLIWQIQLAYRGKVGSIAGSVRNDGYRQVGIKRTDYLLHRLVFMYFHGYMPKYIDHIDGDRSNNKIENLRECTNQQNSFNASISKNNTSGVRGVSWDKERKKWEAKCTMNRKTIHLGRFESLDDACIALRSWREQNHGQFARHN
jgi:hypothetical protein